MFSWILLLLFLPRISIAGPKLTGRQALNGSSLLSLAGFKATTTVVRHVDEDDCLTNKYYDVTNAGTNIDSQPDFDDPDSEYPSNQRRCIWIVTNRSNHVILLDEKYFRLESSISCIFDSLSLYDSCGFDDYIGEYCGDKGPGTRYSSGRHWTLYFYTDAVTEYRGYRFYASSIHENDVPSSLSVFAIICIVAASCLAIVVIVSTVVYCKQRCDSERTRGAIQPTADQGRTRSNPLYNPQAQSGQTSVETTSYTPNPQYALPSYNEVTNNNDIYPVYETIEETNIDSLEVVDSNAGATQTETDQQPPPSYDEAIVQNLQNGQARTEGVTGDNQSRLVLQIPARSADQSNDAAHPVSPPPEYHP